MERLQRRFSLERALFERLQRQIAPVKLLFEDSQRQITPVKLFFEGSQRPFTPERVLFEGSQRPFASERVLFEGLQRQITPVKRLFEGLQRQIAPVRMLFEGSQRPFAPVQTLAEGLPDDVFERDGLESHVRHARFVKDTHGFFINHREARIAPTFALVEHHLVFFRPGKPSIEAGFDRDVVSVRGRVRVREKEEILLQDVLVGGYMNEACHANRFR